MMSLASMKPPEAGDARGLRLSDTQRLSRGRPRTGTFSGGSAYTTARREKPGLDFDDAPAYTRMKRFLKTLRVVLSGAADANIRLTIFADCSKPPASGGGFGAITTSSFGTASPRF